jgi:hypothetical protein
MEWHKGKDKTLFLVRILKGQARVMAIYLNDINVSENFFIYIG